MGGSVWRDNGDGTFTPSSSWSGLSWLDLYAMGLAEVSEVPDVFILRNLKAVVEGSHNPRGETYRGGVYTGDKEIISIEQIVAAEGPRRPGASQSQKDFTLGFVYLLAPGQAPSGDLLDAHARLVREFPANWSRITGGRSRFSTPLPDRAESPCEPNAETLCLHGNRYEVRVDWWTGDGETGSAQVVPEATGRLRSLPVLRCGQLGDPRQGVGRLRGERSLLGVRRLDDGSGLCHPCHRHSDR